MQALSGDVARRRRCQKRHRRGDVVGQPDPSQRDPRGLCRQRGGIALVARAIPNRIRTIEELALPPVVFMLTLEAVSAAPPVAMMA